MDGYQLRAIIRMRWQLILNQLRRNGCLNIVLTTLIITVVLVLIILIGIIGVFAGSLVLVDARPLQLLISLDLFAGMFLFTRMISLISEFRHPDTIDISRMRYLPISLKDILVINYAASHLTVSNILLIPFMLGICLGLALNRGGYMIGMIPVMLGFIFMINAWMYCMRGWLLKLTMNKSKFKIIIIGIIFGFILFTQISYPLSNIWQDHRLRNSERSQSSSTETRLQIPSDSTNPKTLSRRILLAHHFVPFLWVGNSVMSLAEGKLVPAILGTIGGFGIGALGLRRAYYLSLGLSRKQPADKKTARKTKVDNRILVGFLEKRLPGGKVMSSTVTFFCILWRTSAMRVVLGTELIYLLIFSAVIFSRRLIVIDDNYKPLVATGVVVFLLFGMSHLMFNQFGLDRNGFRSLILLPTHRKYILLGKNFSFSFIVVGIGLFLLLFKLAFDISCIVYIAINMQLLAAFLLLSIMGNLFSILAPYYISSGLRLSRIKSKTLLLNFISKLLLSIAMMLIFLPSVISLQLSRVRGLPSSSTNLLLSAVLLGLFFLFYCFSLVPLGNLLQKREKEILQIVTQEVE